MPPRVKTRVTPWVIHVTSGWLQTFRGMLKDGAAHETFPLPTNGHPRTPLHSDLHEKLGMNFSVLLLDQCQNVKNVSSHQRGYQVPEGLDRCSSVIQAYAQLF